MTSKKLQVKPFNIIRIIMLYIKLKKKISRKLKTVIRNKQKETKNESLFIHRSFNNARNVPE